MNPEPEVVSAYPDTSFCDIIGELQGKHMYDVTDHILLYIDCSSLKNVGLVSKSWRAAMLVVLRAIARKGNPNWSADQLKSWQRFQSHLKNDFKVPVQDPHYGLRLTNSINLIIDHFQDGYWNKPEMTLDYLPYLRKEAEDSRIEHLCRMEMNEKFIVAWESSTRLFKCWSRRTLSPISMDQEFQMQHFPSISLDDVNKQFHLLGNYLLYAKSSTSNRRGNFAKVDLRKVDLDAKSRGIDEAEKFMASIFVELPTDKATLVMVYFDAVDDMILMMFSVCIDERFVGEAVTVQRNVERQEAREILKGDLLRVPGLFQGKSRSSANIFLDKNYLIVPWNSGYRTYSLHPSKDGGGAVELRLIASFQLLEPMSVDYRDGLLAYTTRIANIVFVDVSNGSILAYFRSPVNFLRVGSGMRLGKGVLICTEIIAERSSRGLNLLKGIKATTFRVWDLRSIVNKTNHLLPICIFKTLTSNVVSFIVDDLGIAALIQYGSPNGIQVLSFLPACSYCKRLTKPALLAKCYLCSSAAYCSKKCREADWHPHHEAICFKVRSLSFR